MFLKNNPPSGAQPAPSSNRKESLPSLVTKDFHVLGNIITEGNIDFDGSLDGNVRANTITIRNNASIKGEIVANTVLVYGKVRGLIRAKNIQLFASCNVEGILMHETISIEDGAFVDGKFKRTDKINTDEDTSGFVFEGTSEEGGENAPKILENLRLIR